MTLAKVWKYYSQGMNKLLSSHYTRKVLLLGKNRLNDLKSIEGRTLHGASNTIGSKRRTPVTLVIPRDIHSSSVLRSEYFTKDHEWIRMEKENVGMVGITKYAQEQLGDIVYCELPEVGSIFSQRDSMGVIESVKAASDLYAPVSATILGINEEATEDPSIISSSPTDKGWLVKIELSELTELDKLMDSEKYGEYISDLED